MGRTKVIALKRKREPDFDSDRLLVIIISLLILIITISKASAQPVNDNACNATVINVGLNSPFTNVGATSQFGEPAIPTGTCTAQGNWCSGETAPQLRSTVWFKFTVPATGTGSYAFRVNGTSGTFDSQVALFYAATCNDLTNGNAVRLGANDDSTGSAFNSYMTVRCLTPTLTYYILVDGYGTTTSSSFYVHVIELTDRYAVANAGPDQTICYSLFPQFQTNGSVLGVAGSTTWTTTGDGTFSNPAALNALYSPGPNDKTTGQASLILSTDDPAGLCGISRDTMVLSIIPDSIYAGADKTICSSEEFVSMTGSAFLFTSYQWTSTGDGTFDNPALLNAKYYPGPVDRLQPFVNVVLRGVSTQCFNTVYDTVRIFNSNSPGALVNVGNDTTVCSGGAISLSAQQLANYSSLLWTTSGNGTFSNATIANPVYTPGSADLNNGTVTLTLNAQGISPCQGAKSDSKIITIIKQPVISSISGGGSYCSNSTVNLNASALNYASLQWTTSGDGSFTSPSALATNYVPGVNDKINGFVSLSLQANANAPCTNNTSSSVNILITPAPEITLTAPAQSCGSNVISLNASVSNYQTISWSGGDGTFDDPTSVKPKYTPGASDIASGTVTFNVVVLGNNPCNAFFASTSTSIIPDPFVSASAPASVCNGNNISVNSTLNNVSLVTWTTGGDGVFMTPNAPGTIYIPGPSDLANGSVSLFITANGLNPCNAVANDAVTVNFADDAFADAGPDEDIVAGQAAVLDGFAAGASAWVWTTSGDGTFNNPGLLNAVYTPGPNDIAAGNVLLTLHVTASAPCSSVTTDVMEVNIFPDALMAFKLYIEGMYTHPGNYPSLYNNGYNVNPSSADSITIRLHNAVSPYAEVASYTTILASNGIAVISIPGTLAGNSYYISIHHRNALEIWSAAPVLINSFGLLDFTSSPVLRSGKHDDQSGKSGTSW